MLSVHNHLVTLTKFKYLLQKCLVNLVSDRSVLHLSKTFSITIDYFVEITKRKFIL